jgi:spore germination protein PF
MPSFVHNVKIVEIERGSSVVNGDSLMIIPTSNSKTYFGAGSAITGDVGATFNAESTTLTNDRDVIDSKFKVGTAS